MGLPSGKRPIKESDIYDMSLSKNIINNSTFGDILGDISIGDKEPISKKIKCPNCGATKIESKDCEYCGT